MRDIRDTFCTKMDELLAFGQSVSAIAMLGRKAIKDLVAKHPDADYGIGVGPPEVATITSDRLRLDEALQTYERHKNDVLEMVHGQFIQEWGYFLDRVFLRILDDISAGRGDYRKLPRKAKISVDVGPEQFAHLGTEIQKGLLRWFQFEDSEKRLKTIEDALGAKADEAVKRAIRKHVMVRSVIQHNEGILRDEDLVRAGSSDHILMLDAKHEPKEFRTGDKVVPTFWELRAVRDDLKRAAHSLIP